MIDKFINIEVAESFEEVFDNTFMNSVVYYDRTGYSVRNPFSQYNFMYSGTVINVRGRATISYATFQYLHIFVNDVYYTRVAITNTLYHEVALPAGIKKVTIIEGATSQPNNTGDVLGTWLTGLNLDVNRYRKINQLDQAERVVFLGDSITVGDSATNQMYGYSMSFKTLHNKDVAVLGWGWARMYDFASDSTKINDTVSKIRTLFTGISVKRLGIALLTNDYGLDSRAAATVIAYYQNLVQAVHADDPDISIYCIEPLYRYVETTLLQDYRDLLEIMCTGLVYPIRIAAKNCLTYPGDYSGSVHPNDPGQEKLGVFTYNEIYGG